nr:uncharacterized mitochondrial protein AtMg00810-like isoform X2 [Tanacetum cinerariifolium]
MKDKYDALMKNETWSLVPRASNTNVVDGKWVYRLKRDKNDAITHYKARFVAKGFRQQPGIDFHETFSPVVKSTTIRAVLSLAVTNDRPLCQLDIHNAFLHGNRNNKGTINNIICQLGSAFALIDLGPLNYFLAPAFAFTHQPVAASSGPKAAPLDLFPQRASNVDSEARARIIVFEK